MESSRFRTPVPTSAAAIGESRMKLRSSSIDETLNELDLVLREQRTAAARYVRADAKRRYRNLHRDFLRVLRAANRGAFQARRRGRR
jgi:hypothetical protein